MESKNVESLDQLRGMIIGRGFESHLEYVAKTYSNKST